MKPISAMLPALVVALAFALGGCSTHDDRFADKASPRAADLAELRSASEQLLKQGSGSLLSASPDALADYTEAAAAHFEATGAPGVRKLVFTFADALLDAQVVSDGSQGIASGTSPKTSPTATLRGGLAFLAAYEAANDARYAGVARRYARLVPTAGFGWRRSGDVATVQTAGVKGASISRTALAGAFLAEAHRVLGTTTDADGRRAIKLVLDEQAAVGRWYSDTVTKRAMDLDQWATTVYALERSRSKAAVGYLGGGVIALSKAAFDPNGKPLRKGFAADSIGVGHAMTALAGYPDIKISGPVYRAALASTDNFAGVRSDDIEAEAAMSRAMASGFLAETRRLAGK